MKSTINIITPEQALAMQAEGALLIDVREPDEHALGLPVNALAVPRANLELDPSSYIRDFKGPLLLFCGSGRRSMFAGEALLQKGYRNLFNVEGGYQRWKSENLPVQGGELDDDFNERYARHLRLPQVGVEGQKKLEAAHIVLVGAGGLGSPAAYYLAAAGIGKISIIDNDVVDKSNLQRQILHTETSIGTPKVDSAMIALNALNPRVKILKHQARLGPDNVHDIIPTRYLLNDACVGLAKPMVYAAVERFNGQISVFDAGRHRGISPCYRCLFPEAPAGVDAPNCAEAGVLGVLPGVMGLLQATEAIKLVLNIGKTLSGRLLQFDALSMRFSEIYIPVDHDCPCCGLAKL